MMKYHGVLALIGLFVLSLFGTMSLSQAGPLVGGVTYREIKAPEILETNAVTYPYHDGYQLKILDETTGQGIGGVDVWIPKMGYHQVSNDRGVVKLPVRPSHSSIARFKVDGYAPKTLTLGTAKLEGLPNTEGQFQVQLKKSETTVIIDDAIRHLGDGTYAPNSAGSYKFRQQAQGPVLTKKFRLNGSIESSHVILTVGSVVGLDTIDAHYAGQSRFHKSSSPMVVTLNGSVVGYIKTNGDGTQFVIPKHQLSLNGVNTLAIHTGYHRPDGVRIDYDDMEFMLLTLDF